MTAIEQLKRLVEAHARYGELIQRQHSEDDRIEAMDECEAAIDNTDFAALLAEVEGLVRERDTRDKWIRVAMEHYVKLAAALAACGVARCEDTVDAVIGKFGELQDGSESEPRDPAILAQVKDVLRSRGYYQHE